MPDTAPEGAVPPADEEPRKRRNPWIWVSAVLALVAIGLLAWSLSTRSDLDSAQQDLDNAQAQLDSTKQELESTNQKLDSTSQKLDSTSHELESTTQDYKDLEASQASDDKGAGRAVLAGGAFVTAKALYDDLAEQLGATQVDLEATQKDLEEANAKAEQADKAAADAQAKAEKAGNETDKANAEAEQAKAEQEAVESKAKVAADCVKAYVSSFGMLFEGDGPRAQAPAVREQFSSISADCKTALGGASG